MGIRRVGLVLLTATFAVAASGLRADNSAGAQNTKIVKVAMDLPFSGSSERTMISMAEAFELAVAQSNKHGLPGGYHVEVVRLDEDVEGKTWDADSAARDAEKSVADPEILAAFGPQFSTPAKRALPILNAAGIAMISSSATTPGLTKGASAAALRRARPNANNFFRVCGTDDLQGPSGAQIVTNLGLKTVYTIDDSDTYGKGLSDFFDSAFRTRGGTVLAHEHTQISQRDYRALIARIKASHAQAVYFGAYGIEQGIFRKQMAEGGLASVPLIGGDGMDESDFAPAAGPAAKGSYYTMMTPNGLYLSTPQAKAFARAFEAAYDKKPLAFDTGAYAAGQVTMAAIHVAFAENNGALPTRDQVRAAMARTTNLSTAIGPVTFDAQGDIRDPYVSFYTYDQNGQKLFVRQFSYHVP